MNSSAPELPPDVNRGVGVNIIGWIGFSLSAVFVAIRLFSRFKILRTPGWDDAIIIFSLALSLVSTALSSTAVSCGLGRHIEYIEPAAISRILYLAAILQPIGIGGYTVPKLAVVIVLIKLMGPKKTGQWFLYSIIAVLYISSALTIIMIFAQCDPPSHFWHPEQPANCLSPLVLQRITLFAGAWSAFVDLCLALFPITIFWDLQMKMHKKISICIVMGLGILAMACAIIKTANLPKEQDPDFTYAFFDLVIWTFIETDVVIICACVPFVPRVWNYIRKQEYRSNYASKHTATYQNSTVRARLESTRRGKNSYTPFGNAHDMASGDHDLEPIPSDDNGGITKTVRIEQSHDFV